MPTAPSAAARRRQAIVTAIALVVIGVVVAITWLINHHSEQEASTSAAKTSAVKTTAAKTTSKKATTRTSSPRTSRAASAATVAPQAQGRVPANALATLKLIDAGRWPEAANAPGTNGGTEFRNSQRRLPTTDDAGARISYQEWDVNAKKPGRGRDAERIVTGSDGSAWYTGDHYDTFVLIRGPTA